MDHKNNPSKYLNDRLIKYLGMFSAGIYNGQGQILNIEGGKIYEGEWKNGKKSGFGTFYGKNGKIVLYRGGWKNDKYCGDGVCY